ncbi:MAG: hypothetical protein IPF93_22130 [Saprospiraceae bacterium]|nr:hypothetical protein [Saprospiraceae bacterium]
MWIRREVCQSATIDSVITDSDGKYVFDSLIAGQHLGEIPGEQFLVRANL